MVIRVKKNNPCHPCNPQSVPKLPMRFRTFVPANHVRKDSGEIRTFAAVAATLLTLGCTDASIVPLSLNRSVAPANNVRKDSGEIRTFAAVAATLLTLGNADASIASRSLNRSVAVGNEKARETET